MIDKVHLAKPTRDKTYCNIETYLIYTKKGVELAGMDRLIEVNCEECLKKATSHWYNKENRVRRKQQYVRNMYNWFLDGQKGKQPTP